jgi:hypothetical protein
MLDCFAGSPRILQRHGIATPCIKSFSAVAKNEAAVLVVFRGGRPAVIDLNLMAASSSSLNGARVVPSFESIMIR